MGASREYIVENTNFVHGYQNLDFKFIFDDRRKKEYLIIEVHKNGIKKEYPADYFLDLVLNGYYFEIEKTKDFGKRINLIYDAKGELIHCISRIEIELKNHLPKLDYDFKGTIDCVNVVIDKLKMELDVNEYNLKIKKLKIETSWYLLFAMAAAIIAIYNFTHQR